MTNVSLAMGGRAALGVVLVTGFVLSAQAATDTPVSEALQHRLGQGHFDRETTAQAPTAVRGGDVLPEYDERTSTHLDLAGQSPTDMTRRRLAIGDFDRNGLEDVFVARWDARAQLYLNLGTVLTRQTTAFASPTDLDNAHHAGVLDADDDGWPDLIVRNRLLMNRGEDAQGQWLGFAAGTVISGAENNPFGIETADFDGDGSVDAVTVPGRRMLVNDGNGVLAHDGSRMGSNTLNAVIKFDAKDFDGDGDIDLAGPRTSEDAHYVYYNDGSGRFTNSARLSLNLDSLTYVQAAADFNGDDIGDFRIYSDFESPRAFMSTGSFTGQFPDYQRRADPLIEGDQGKHGLSHVRDVDNDGDLDFVLSSIELFSDRVDLLNEKNNLILNSGVNSGTFVSVFDAEWGDEEAYDIRLMDVNDDGNYDLFIAHETRLAVYINGATPQTLNLTGHTSLPTEIGASASMSVTIDGATSPQYEWDFGDGSPGIVTSTPNATHTYVAAGRYPVTVTVSAGAASDSRVFWHTAFAPRTTGKATHSSAMAYQTLGGNADDDRVVVVNSDHDSITVLRLGDGARLAEVPVGDRPVSVAIAGDTAWVVNKDDATISLVDLSALSVTQTLTDLPRGSAPHGIVLDTTQSQPVGIVALEALGAVARLAPGTGASIQALGPTPRELALDASQTSLLVSRFITAPVPGEHTRNLGTAGGGEVWTLNAATLALEETTLVAYNDEPDDVFSARGIPNYLMAPIVAPSGAFAFVPASSSNIYRGTFRDGNAREHNMLVRSMLARVNLGTRTEDIAARHDFDNSAQPTAGAFDPTGNYLYLVFENARVLRVYDIYGGNSLASVALDFAPNAVTVSPDGRRIVTHNWLGRSVSVIAADDFVDGVSNEHVLLAEFDTTASEVLTAQMLRGKQLFFDSADPRLTAQGYIACSTCHADGGHDGRTWDFADVGEGLRNTADLRARAGVGHGNVHWTANFDEIHDFENDMRDIFQGSGLMDDADFMATSATLGAPKAGLSPDLDALAAFVTSLATTGPSPHRASDGAMTSAGVAGAQLFFELDCAACHSGTAFTDSPAGGQFHDIGTVDADTGGRLGQPLPDGGLDTPTLLGLWSTAPYLHDGSAATLIDAVQAHTGGAIGTAVAALDAAELSQLAAFLGQIESGTTLTDGDTDGIIDQADNCPDASNAGQRDTDGDGFGNVCDADLNNDGIVNVVDLGLLRAVFFTADPDADFNGDGVVNVVDLGILRAMFFGPPG